MTGWLAGCLTLGALALVGACGDPASGLSARRANPIPDDQADGGNTGDANLSSRSAEEQLFRALEPELTRTCGGNAGACHVEGRYPGNPILFLAAPDAYKSVLSIPTLVTRDVYESRLVARGGHAGPALSADKELEKKVIAWLEAESLVIRSQKLPSTDPVTVQLGANDVDLGKAASPGLGAVHLKFDAALVAGVLSLSKLRLATAAGTAVHLLKPRFVLVRPGAETVDPADSFSNSDQVVPGGVDTAISPGTVLFASDEWIPFDFATHQLRIEVEKLEPGTVSVIVKPKVCANPALFGTNVLPALRATMAANGTCNSCHGGGVQPSLQGNDPGIICATILERLDPANIVQSRMITKVTQAGHTGGLVVDPTTYRALFVNNANVFF